MTSHLRALLDSAGVAEGDAWHRRLFEPSAVIVRAERASHEVCSAMSGAVRIVATVTLEDQRNTHPGYCDLGSNELFGELRLLDDRIGVISVSSMTFSGKEPAAR